MYKVSLNLYTEYNTINNIQYWNLFNVGFNPVFLKIRTLVKALQIFFDDIIGNTEYLNFQYVLFILAFCSNQGFSVLVKTNIRTFQEII